MKYKVWICGTYTVDEFAKQNGTSIMEVTYVFLQDESHKLFFTLPPDESIEQNNFSAIQALFKADRERVCEINKFVSYN